MEPLADSLEMLINLSKHHLRPLLKKGVSGPSRTIIDEESDESEEEEEEGKTHLIYRSLTTQSIGMYVRKVLDAFCRQVLTFIFQHLKTLSCGFNRRIG